MLPKFAEELGDGFFHGVHRIASETLLKSLGSMGSKSKRSGPLRRMQLGP
jgi:hypothetical protein